MIRKCEDVINLSALDAYGLVLFESREIEIYNLVTDSVFSKNKIEHTYQFIKPIPIDIQKHMVSPVRIIFKKILNKLAYVISKVLFINEFVIYFHIFALIEHDFFFTTGRQH